MPDDVRIDIDKLKSVVLKLLDKAGADKRLTPGILRRKAEQKMKLDDGALKTMKPNIMKYITKWWDANFSRHDVNRLKNMLKFAKASGFNDYGSVMSEAPPAARADEIRKRLQGEGCVVPEDPTDLDISAASKKRQNDLDEVDSKKKNLEATKPSATGKELPAAKDAIATKDEIDITTSSESETTKDSPATAESRAEKVSGDVNEDEEAEF